MFRVWSNRFADPNHTCITRVLDILQASFSAFSSGIKRESFLGVLVKQTLTRLVGMYIQRFLQRKPTPKRYPNLWEQMEWDMNQLYEFFAESKDLVPDQLLRQYTGVTPVLIALVAGPEPFMLVHLQEVKRVFGGFRHVIETPVALMQCCDVRDDPPMSRHARNQLVTTYLEKYPEEPKPPGFVMTPFGLEEDEANPSPAPAANHGKPVPRSAGKNASSAAPSSSGGSKFRISFGWGRKK